MILAAAFLAFVLLPWLYIWACVKLATAAVRHPTTRP